MEDDGNKCLIARNVFVGVFWMDGLTLFSGLWVGDTIFSFGGRNPDDFRNIEILTKITLNVHEFTIKLR